MEFMPENYKSSSRHTVGLLFMEANTVWEPRLEVQGEKGLEMWEE